MAQEGYLLFDETGILDCNEAAVRSLGYAEKHEILGSHPARFSPEYQPDGRSSAEKSREMDGIADAKGFHK